MNIRCASLNNSRLHGNGQSCPYAWVPAFSAGAGTSFHCVSDNANIRAKGWSVKPQSLIGSFRTGWYLALKVSNIATHTMLCCLLSKGRWISGIWLLHSSGEALTFFRRLWKYPCHLDWTSYQYWPFLLMIHVERHGYSLELLKSLSSA